MSFGHEAATEIGHDTAEAGGANNQKLEKYLSY